MFAKLFEIIFIVKQYLLIYLKNYQYLKPNFYLLTLDGRYITPYFSDYKKRGLLNNDSKYRSFGIVIFLVNLMFFFLSFFLFIRKPLFDGDFLYITNNSTKSDSKVFSFNQGLVLEIYTDYKNIDKIVEIYALLKTKINLPKIRKASFKNSIFSIFIKEDFEIRKAVKNDLNFLINLLKLHDNILTFEGLSKNNFNKLRLRFVNDKNKRLLDNIIDYVSNYDDLIIPLSFTHGDMSMSNVIIESIKSVYFIDWEHFKKREFYYDFFFLLFNESYSFKRDFFIKSYFEGNFDNYLQEIFIKLKIEFNPDYKMIYFVRAFLVFIDERVQPSSSKDALKKYLNIFDNISFYLKLLNKT